MNTFTAELGSQLLASNKLDQADLDLAIHESKKTGERLGTVLIRRGLCTEADVLGALADQLGLRFVDLGKTEPDRSAIEAVSAKLANHYNVFPVEATEDSILVALNDPFNMHALDDLRLALHRDVEAALAPAAEIAKAIKKYYGIGADTIQALEQEAKQETKESEDTFGLEYEMDNVDIESDSEANDASIVRFVNQFIAEAIRDRATDIHVEPFEEELRIRYRIDGRLYEAAIPAAIKRYQSAIISRLKIMANLDIAERRLPQDGKIKIRMARAEFDLRVSTVPTTYGESLSIRILTRDSELVSLDKLGLDPHHQALVRAMIQKPHGVVLVTGPTGSGKSTTLYASLTELNQIDKKIITIEDPIEYRIKGVTQIQVHPDIGLTFARALRTILRQDPDIIMVGETRDTETAQNTIRAALTGHLVFTTLHTNDACSAFNRLIDMGIEPFLVSSTVEGVVAQRLVRRLCSECKQKSPPDIPALAREFAIPEADIVNANTHKPVGCERCRYTGYRGRVAIHEVVKMSDGLKKQIMERATATELRKRAVQLGMRTIRLDGWLKVRDGVTTPDEVLRVTMEEGVE